jgi:hypothetical protein
LYKRQPQERASARYAVARALRELDRLAEAVEELQAARAESPGPDPIIEEELAAALALLSPSRHEHPA